MNVQTKDACPSCQQKGLLKSDLGKPRRRKCVLCSAEEPREGDRVLYLACSSSVEFYTNSAGEAKARLDSAGSVEPFFDRQSAEDYLDGLRAAAGKRAPGWYRWEPATVEGRPGVIGHSNGGAIFYYVRTKLVDVRPILKDEKKTCGTSSSCS